jgi:hypothetical protein
MIDERLLIIIFCFAPLGRRKGGATLFRMLKHPAIQFRRVAAVNKLMGPIGHIGPMGRMGWEKGFEISDLRRKMERQG